MNDILKNEIYHCDIEKTLEQIELSQLNNCAALVTGGLGLICAAVVDLLIVYNEQNNAGIKIYYCKKYTKTSPGKRHDTVGTGGKNKLF